LYPILKVQDKDKLSLSTVVEQGYSLPTDIKSKNSAASRYDLND